MNSTDNAERGFLIAIRKNPNEITHQHVYADWLEEQGREQQAIALRNGIVKRYGIDFQSDGGALTLGSGEVGGHEGTKNEISHTHPDGWTITGRVVEDYSAWVNEFSASHPVLGLVWGDFEDLVFASSSEAFQDFYTKHKPEAWDYQDI